MNVKRKMPSSGNSMASGSTEHTMNCRQLNFIKSNSFCLLVDERSAVNDKA